MIPVSVFSGRDVREREGFVGTREMAEKKEEKAKSLEILSSHPLCVIPKERLVCFFFLLAKPRYNTQRTFFCRADPAPPRISLSLDSSSVCENDTSTSWQKEEEEEEKVLL